MNSRVRKYVLRQALDIFTHTMAGALSGVLAALWWASNVALQDVAYARTYYIFALLQKYAGWAALFLFTWFVACMVGVLKRNAAEVELVIKRVDGAK